MKPRRIEECGCCEAGISPTPEPITNRPGLPAISYRVGTYASFRQAMIEAIARSPELKSWTGRRSDDYGIALIDMWAYLADILTFYQERIANEAFLRTASHHDTIMRLASMLDYKLNPGVAATAHLAFFAEENKQVKIPVGLRVQSVPGQDEEPQKFETVENIETFSNLNEIRVQQTETQYLLRGINELVLKGINTGLQAGDYLLVVGEHHKNNPGSERWDLRKISSLTPDPETQTTTVKLDNPLGHWRVNFPTKEENDELKIYAMRLTAWLFGVNAPDWRLLPSHLTTETGAPFPNDWTDETLPEDENNPNHILLDTVYETIVQESWIALVTAERPTCERYSDYSGYVEVYFVESVDKTVKTNYALSSKVTRLTVHGTKEKGSKEKIRPENIDCFPMKATFALAQSEPLEKADIAIKGPIKGNILNFDKYQPNLKVKQSLIVKGELLDSPGEKEVEVVQVKEVVHNDILTKTSVTLKNDLQNSYVRKTVRVYGNVAKSTHGETVSGELLGSGDASSEFQGFTLKKSPTTYVPALRATRGAQNTLKVRVGGVLWQEVESFYGQEFDDQIYITRVDGEGKMAVRFGDGKTGARLPTGRDNVVAEYRQGLGSEGNVPANSLTTLLDRPVGLKRVTNPKEAEGGTNPESLLDARVNAPNTVTTFERAISLRDYEDLARNYTGIAKARAVRVFKNENEMIQLTIAGENGQRIELGSPIYENFLGFLNLHRDINHPLEVIPHSDKLLLLQATIRVDPAYVEDDVISVAKKAVLSYFDFDNLQFGEGIHLSDIYAVLQSVEGVIAADINSLCYKKDEKPSVEPHLRIEPDHIAALEDADLEITSDLT